MLTLEGVNHNVKRIVFEDTVSNSVNWFPSLKRFKQTCKYQVGSVRLMTHHSIDKSYHKNISMAESTRSAVQHVWFFCLNLLLKMDIPKMVRGMLPSGVDGGLYLIGIVWGGGGEEFGTNETFWRESEADSDEARCCSESISVKCSVNTYKWKRMQYIVKERHTHCPHH